MISKKTKKVSPPIDEWLKEAKADPATRYVPAVVQLLRKSGIMRADLPKILLLVVEKCLLTLKI